MSITIVSNIAALGAQRQLHKATNGLGQTFERLASGLRINRASDDAAGLSVSAQLDADARILQQGLKNVNDGIGLLNVAESAVRELGSIVTRLEELAHQSANGIYSNEQRTVFQEEADALSAEYYRIIETTEFNNIQLFQEEATTLRVQFGVGIENSLEMTLGRSLRQTLEQAFWDGTFGSINSLDGGGQESRNLSIGDVDGDGVDDVIAKFGSDFTTFLSNGDGTFKAGILTNTQADNFPRGTINADLNNDGKLDVITQSNSGTAYVRIGNGDGTFKTGGAFSMLGEGGLGAADFNGDGKIDLVSATETTDLIYRPGLGDGTFGASTSFVMSSVGAFQAHSAEIGDFNGDGLLDIAADISDNDTVAIMLGNGNGTFKAGVEYDVFNQPEFVVSGYFNDDNILDLAVANRGDSNVSILLGNSNGTFQTGTNFSMGAGVLMLQVADFNGDGLADLIGTSDATNNVQIRLGTGNGSFKGAQNFTYDTRGLIEVGDFNEDGVPDFVTNRFSAAGVVLANTTIQQSVPQIDLSTQEASLDSMSLIDSMRAAIQTELGAIGAAQSRLDTVFSVVSVAAKNYRDASSRIKDADIALEAASLVKKQILQQAANAVLTQANQLPTLALRLLSS